MTRRIEWFPAPGWPAGRPIDLAAWPLEPIKLASHRDVFRVRLPELDLHVKHYRPDGRERLRWFFRPLKAHSEFERGLVLRRRDVPTLEPLAWGRSGLDSYLITRTLPEAVPLLDWLEGGVQGGRGGVFDAPGEGPHAEQRPGASQGLSPGHPNRGKEGGLSERRRFELAEVLGRFLAAAHAAGVCHDDLHPGNLLVRTTPRIELYLIDLHLARVGPVLPWTASRDNLIVLDRWFAARFSRADRLRAWRAYVEARPLPGVDFHHNGIDLARRTHASALDFMKELDDRCRGKGRHFRKLAGGLAVATLDPAILRALRTQADEQLDSPEARTLKRSKSSAVVELEVMHEGEPRPMVLKRFDATRWSDALTAWARPDAALRSWRMGHALTVRGLPTPRCLAVWHNGATGYLLQEKVPDATHLKAFLDSLRPNELGRKRAMLHQVGRLLRRLHDWRVSHRDLKAANLLVSPARAAMGVRGLGRPQHDGGDHVWLVDLAGAAVRRRLDDRRKARDLARLNVSFLSDPDVTNGDRLRLLSAYLNWALAGRGGWKGWWRQIAAASEAKRERNRRLGRVVG